jgi:protein-S-isoprenylcysteine O-methyltransferase Ste14
MSRCDPADPDRSAGARTAEAAPGAFAGYCVLTGTLATAAGAAASLAGRSLAERVVLWAVVLVLTAGAAGWWWTSAPATARRWTVGFWARPAARDAPTQTLSRKS